MKIIAVFLVAQCLMFSSCMTTAQAGTFPYGRQQIADAGAGCVGGLKSAHGDVAYFRGDTGRLNEKLALLAKNASQYQSIKVVLRAGVKSVDPPEETPQTGFEDQARDQRVRINWSIMKCCSFDNVAAGNCKHHKRAVIIDVWIGNAIRLDDLKIPSEFTVQSAGDFEAFAKRHADAK